MDYKATTWMKAGKRAMDGGLNIYFDCSISLEYIKIARSIQNLVKKHCVAGLRKRRLILVGLYFLEDKGLAFLSASDHLEIDSP